MTNIENEFSWSKSRDNFFKECPRKYYFNHYGFWNGWNKNAPEKAQELYILKNLISKEMWIGQVVHNIIKNVLFRLKTGNEISLSYALKLLREKLNENYNNSITKQYKKDPKRIVGLFEHEYDLLIAKDEWDKLFKIAEECLINFYNSDAYRKIKDTSINNWKFLEDFLNFDFEGTKIFLSIDFAMKEGDKIILYDWKTGRERDTDMNIQLACYALFVLNKWDIPPENVIVKVYNLRIDKEDELIINSEVIEKIKDYMRKSINEMQELLKDKEKNIAEEENFPKNESGFCSWCKFKKICLGEIKE